MNNHIIQIERIIGNESMTSIRDLSYYNMRMIERLSKQFGGNIYRLEGKTAKVVVLDTFNEFTRDQAIAIVTKWLQGDYYSYDFDKEAWRLHNE